MSARRYPVAIIITILALPALACSLLQPDSQPTLEDVIEVTNTAIPATEIPAATLTSSPPTEVVATPTSLQADVEPTEPPETAEIENIYQIPSTVGLNENGNWLVFIADSKLWALNSDGSGLTELSAASLPTGLEVATVKTAPSGGLIAWEQKQEGAIFEHVLYITRLPSGDTVRIPLMRDAPTEDRIKFGGDLSDVYTGLQRTDSFAWSPDGQHLAFMAQLDGPSIDLYTYAVADGSITQLTDGPAQGMTPMWSPDSRQIVHAGVESFGTGAGYNMAGVWSAAVDGSFVTTLYPMPPRTAQESIYGFLGNNRVVVGSADISCGTKDLRAVDLETLAISSIWPDYFAGVSIHAESEVVLINSFEQADCTPDPKEGLEGDWLALPEQELRQISEPQAVALSNFMQSPNFSVASDYTSYTLDEGDNYLPENATGIRIIGGSPFAAAYIPDPQSTLLIGSPLGWEPLVSGEDIRWFDWAPDSSDLFFITDTGIYIAPEVAENQPALVTAEFQVWEAYWVRE